MAFSKNVHATRRTVKEFKLLNSTRQLLVLWYSFPFLCAVLIKALRLEFSHNLKKEYRLIFQKRQRPQCRSSSQPAVLHFRRILSTQQCSTIVGARCSWLHVLSSCELYYTHDQSDGNNNLPEATVDGVVQQHRKPNVIDPTRTLQRSI